MDNILSRIQEIALNEGITIGALERKIGASKGVLSRAINNGTDIQSKWLQTIVENYPIYSTRWLLTGEGSMLRADEAATSSFSSSPNTVQSDAVVFRLMDKLDEKDNIIKELNARILQMSEEIGRWRAKLKEEELHIEGLKPKTAKSVSLKEHSSQSIHDAPSVSAPLKEQ